MYATIQKWGNSQGLRIPRKLLESVQLRENDTVELIQIEGGIEIRPVAVSRHRTLEDRLTAYYGKRIDEIGRITDTPEVEWGKAEGAEVW